MTDYQPWISKRLPKTSCGRFTSWRSIWDDLSIEEMLAAARLHKHRRLPVYDETPSDNHCSVLHTQALCSIPILTCPKSSTSPLFAARRA